MASHSTFSNEEDRLNTMRHYRLVLLFLTSVGDFSHYFAMDYPAAISTSLEEHMMTLTGCSSDQFAYYYGLFFTLYCILNVPLPLIMGVVIDRVGYRKVFYWLSFTLPLSHSLFAIGVWQGSWSLMLVARCILGCTESVQLAVHCLLNRWYRGSEVSFALAINTAAARSGSVMNAFLTPRLVTWVGLNGASLFGIFICTISWVCQVVAARLDFTLGQRANVLENQNREDISLKKVLNIPKNAWLMMAVTVTSYCAITPFYNIASAYFTKSRFGYMPLAAAQVIASKAMTVMVMVTVVGVPCMGYFVDTFGMRTYSLIMGSVLITMTYSIVDHAYAVTSTILLGLAYTAFASIVWASFPLLVPESQLGTCWGIALALYCFGLSLAPLIVAELETSAATEDASFQKVLIFMRALGNTSLGLTLALFFLNRVTNGNLDLPSAQATARMERDQDSSLIKTM